MMTLGQAQAMLPGSRLLGPSATPFTRVHTDTRSIAAGDLFVALKGERFDAHAFLADAARAGATAAIVSHGVELDAKGRAQPLPALLVADTQQALARLAQVWRQRHALPLVAVAGSNGKTTVTQMIGSMLQAWWGDGALVTRGNLNNHIGLPLTLLRLRQDDSLYHRAGVVELGMNHPGEIAELAALAQPTVALVNNAQREHQEFMATVEAVARENGSVISALPPGGTAVYPADDVYSPLWRELAGQRRVLRFSADASSSAEVRCLGAQWVAAAGGRGAHWTLALATPLGDLQTRLHLPGVHNLANAAAAAAGAIAAGCPLPMVADGLARFRAVQGRSSPTQFLQDGRTVTLVDDSYNANPDSMRAAIDLLASLPGPHWLVMGDMGEVGEQGEAFHAEIGRHARERGIEHVWCAGAASRAAAAAFGTGALALNDTDAVVARIDADAGSLPSCASALVKGSRFMRMERVVAALQARPGPGEVPTSAGRAS